MAVQKRNSELVDILKPDIIKIAGVNPKYNPLFSAYVSATVNNVTGDGTDYTVIYDTEIFDIGGNFNTATGIFTAPVTGKYLLIPAVVVGNLGAAHTTGRPLLRTSNRDYAPLFDNPYAARFGAVHGYAFSAIADMYDGDTAFVFAYVGGGAKTVNVTGGAAPYTYFQGFLLTR